MPRIFDNIDNNLLPALQETIALSERGDFCVGFLNLRGWKSISAEIEHWTGGDGHCCRLLVGMQRMPQEEISALLGFTKTDIEMDNATANRLKKELIERFKEQLTIGIPTNEDQAGLRKLANQIKAKKVSIKLFLRHPLHAKLYLLYRSDPNNPITGFLGSSNLTLAGLLKQGELNVDVLDHDASKKLSQWFEDRWNDRWCVDISNDLVDIIEKSWAGDQLPIPYYIYIKIAYHLSRDAREGIAEFNLPKELKAKLFSFQEAAVKIAAYHLNKRDGVLIGDVVGLGKTLMATALARIFEDDYDMETLIICPKNLVAMWEDYRERYSLRGKVIPLSLVTKELPEMRRYRLVLIDESHNLRNREGKHYAAIRDYIQKNDSKCILLSATPYNKTYLDLSNQLRLFLSEGEELPIRPERLLKELGETEFIRRHQCSPRSLAAFEKSEYPDDWRELMRLYLVRRTRTFIIDNYAKTDKSNGRKYLPFEDGKKYYFPARVPKTIKFTIKDGSSQDQYARMYSEDIVNIINNLHLPRYGLGNYVKPSNDKPPSQSEVQILQNLSRAGKRLMGFCRTNIFKRLESSGQVFIQSVERHILRNYVYMHAIENGKDIPIGTQDIDLLDTRISDEDADAQDRGLFDDDDNGTHSDTLDVSTLRTSDDFRRQAAEVYKRYASQGKNRFDWLRPIFFDKVLAGHLKADADALLGILKICGEWNPKNDTKLNELYKLLSNKHPAEKVIIFSQFADTVHYLENQLKARGLTELAGATGNSWDPTNLAWRFSPESNNKKNSIKPADELRILIATDVLSEGQNLQDCAIVVNYDLPWAIIRLVQRIGRIDRIGQGSEKILCYSFLPADGVERIIRLRARVRQRLNENAEVIGTDEAFFEDDSNDQSIYDLFTEKAGILDDETDKEVDLASYAYQIWKNAITENPKLEEIIPQLPNVSYSAQQQKSDSIIPEGVIVYMRTAEDNDALVLVDKTGKSITESQKAILDAAKCTSNTPLAQPFEKHHELVRYGVEQIIKEEKRLTGQLGRPSGARFRTYERLKQYAEEIRGTIFEKPELNKATEDILKYPLQDSAKDTLNHLLKAHVSHKDLAQKVIALRDEGTLCINSDESKPKEPRIICSMGLIAKQSEK